MRGAEGAVGRKVKRAVLGGARGQRRVWGGGGCAVEGRGGGVRVGRRIEVGVSVGVDVDVDVDIDTELGLFFVGVVVVRVGEVQAMGEGVRVGVRVRRSGGDGMLAVDGGGIRGARRSKVRPIFVAVCRGGERVLEASALPVYGLCQTD